MAEQQRICDYEGSDYRTRFWEGQGRDYEDTLERKVLRRLLPKSGKRLLVIGAGFGRLAEEFDMYEQVILLDYSFSQLQYARETYGDGRFTYVAADAYKLPFIDGAFDGATMIRVLHHMEDVPSMFKGIQRVMSDKALFLLEYANKRNLKAMLRHMMGRQAWSPYTNEPVEFVELNYDFHPAYIDEELQKAGFKTETAIPISWLRLGILKKLIPVGALVGMDQALQTTGALYSPSIFTKNIVQHAGVDQTETPSEQIFASPITQASLTRDGDKLISPDGTTWLKREGIYDFKVPI